MEWNNDVFDEFELVYAKVKNNKEILEIWTRLEKAIIQEAVLNYIPGRLLATATGLFLTPNKFHELNDIDKQTSFKTLGEKGIAFLDMSRSEAHIQIVLSDEINRVKACTVLCILNFLEKIDGTQKIGTDKKKWELELQVPLGGSNGLLQWEMLIMRLYPWVSVREVSTNVIAKEAFVSSANDEVLACSICGWINPSSNVFCPNCGKRLKTIPYYDDIEIPKSKNQNSSSEDKISEYLSKRNLLQFADKQYQIKVKLRVGHIVKIQLIGNQNSNDALKILRDKGLLSKDFEYRFANWPSANPVIGPWYHHVSACVCELNPDTVYKVEKIKQINSRMLYGCPNSKSIEKGNILNYVKVEIVDYES